ncbi:unnamed protein product [Linum tenue]|uniref:Uncharacterized protein n=1 Tax=Linum tenue TaxID=586396 RepID=A0AAV0H8C4_9ROSI|nr:unnamed protein product [Linum tenue]
MSLMKTKFHYFLQ